MAACTPALGHHILAAQSSPRVLLAQLLPSGRRLPGLRCRQASPTYCDCGLSCAAAQAYLLGHCRTELSCSVHDCLQLDMSRTLSCLQVPTPGWRTAGRYRNHFYDTRQNWTNVCAHQKSSPAPIFSGLAATGAAITHVAARTRAGLEACCPTAVAFKRLMFDCLRLVVRMHAHCQSLQVLWGAFQSSDARLPTVNTCRICVHSV
jgi:hypothetical protein